MILLVDWRWAATAVTILSDTPNWLSPGSEKKSYVSMLPLTRLTMLPLTRLTMLPLTRCIRLDGWPDELAWACYLAASCLCHLKEYREAEEYCALGMSRKPNAVELPWLTSWCSLERGSYDQAIHWAGIAIGINQERCSPRGDDSVAGFRHLPAWFEAPYDVLRFACRHNNQLEKAEHADCMYQSELHKRQCMFCQNSAEKTRVEH